MGQGTTGGAHKDDKKNSSASVLNFMVSIKDPDKTGNHDTFSIAVTNSTGNAIYQNSGTVQGHIEIHNVVDDHGGHGGKDNGNYKNNSK